MSSFAYVMLFRSFLRPIRLATWAMVCVLVGLMGYGFLRLGGGELPYSILSSILVFKVLPLAGAIFATTVLAQEVEQKTIVYLLTRPIKRSELLLYRILAAATMTFLVSFLSAVVISIVVNGTGFLANEYLWRDVPAIAVGSLAYCVVFTLISLVVNRSMIVNILYAFVWETAIPQMPGSMNLLSISSYLQAISERPGVPSATPVKFLAGMQNGFLPKGQAWAVILIFIVAFAAFAMWWFSHFEYVPREDAE